MGIDPATRELQRRAIGTLAIRHHEIGTRLRDDYLFTQDQGSRAFSPANRRQLTKMWLRQPLAANESNNRTSDQTR